MRFDQLAIAILSPLAVWLTQQPGNERRQRWACIVGLVSQPFWFWSVWQSGDWGIGVGCVIYTAIWVQGAWRYWVRPESLAFQRRMGANSNSALARPRAVSDKTNAYSVLSQSGLSGKEAVRRPSDT